VAGDLRAADAVLSARLAPDVIHDIVALIPDAWLGDEPLFANVAEHRAAYATYLLTRLDVPRVFVEEAIDAQARLL
jgi:hypothetical protein